jgi:endonuclease/exonuclease/phosphatase family metal-dependent hydrolase
MKSKMLATAKGGQVRVDTPTIAPRRVTNRTRRAVLWLTGILLAAAVVWSGSERVPEGPALGTAFQGDSLPSPARNQRIRLATFNIHGGKGRDGVRDLSRIATELQEMDLVGLNEVHGGQIGESIDQAEQLGRQLGVSWLFAPTEHRWWRSQFGNGVLTSLKVAAWQRIPLPRQYGKSYRNLVLLRVDHPSGPMHVIVTHLDRSDDRDRTAQLTAAANLFLSLAEPAVLMGDMNTTADDPIMARLLRTPGVHDPLVDILSKEADKRIDWILVRGCRSVDAGLVNSGVSDHPMVWAEVEVGSRKSEVGDRRPEVRDQKSEVGGGQ